MTQKPFTILMAEDDAEDRMLAKDALKEAGLDSELLFVNDGEELMTFLHQQGENSAAPRPSLVLLDLSMPKKNGLEALAEIKAEPALREIPVIVLTTSSAQEDMARSYDLGVDSFVTKPVKFSQLVQLMEVVGLHLAEISN